MPNRRTPPGDTALDVTRNTRFDRMIPAGKPEGDEAAEEPAT